MTVFISGTHETDGHGGLDLLVKLDDRCSDNSSHQCGFDCVASHYAIQHRCRSGAKGNKSNPTLLRADGLLHICHHFPICNQHALPKTYVENAHVFLYTKCLIIVVPTKHIEAFI